MNFIELTAAELQKVQDLKDSFLIVESQVYGQVSDFRYHIAFGENLVEEFEKREIGRVIKDSGRTIGYWQNLAGKGVYKPNLVSLQNYPDNVSKILKTREEARLTVTSKTWVEIIGLCPFDTEFKTMLGLNEKTVKVSPKRKTAKSKTAK
jgi:hypothetical protein